MPDGRYESPFATAQDREEINNPPTKIDRIRRRTLVVLALATAVGSIGLAAGAGAPVVGMVVAFGRFTTLSLAGEATSMLALVFVWR